MEIEVVLDWIYHSRFGQKVLEKIYFGYWINDI